MNMIMVKAKILREIDLQEQVCDHYSKLINDYQEMNAEILICSSF